MSGSFTRTGHECTRLSACGEPVCEWNLDEEGSSFSIGTGHVDLSAERFDAVSETDEARPLLGVCPSDAIVANRELEERVLRFQVDMDYGRVGVFGHVGERFRHEVIDGHLDVLRQSPVGGEVELDRDGRAAGERLEGGPETALRE